MRDKAAQAVQLKAPDCPQWVDKTHPQFEKAAIQKVRGLNVGNPRYTGHSTDLTPSAGMAEKLSLH